jgi:PTH1 family peptidyl-tRNA hydrolase
VVGLGNPGPEYADTRHNVGFRVVEAFAAQHGGALAGERYGGRHGLVVVDGRATALLEPLTWMNASGDAVAAACQDLADLDPAADLVVVYDDLDLPLGRIRIRGTGGAGGHRGMKSVIERLERSDFVRLRFGIGRPGPGEGVVDHVLAPFSAAEEEALAPAIRRAAEALTMTLTHGVEAAMDRFNG